MVVGGWGGGCVRKEEEGEFLFLMSCIWLDGFLVVSRLGWGGR